MITNIKPSTLINLLLGTALLLMAGYLIIVEKSRPIVIGRAERVGVEDIDTLLKARIDTGAGITSLNARIIEVTTSKARGEPDRVKFEIKDDAGHAKILEKEIIDWQRIKNKGDDGYTKRPVVKMDLCLGGKEIDGRVNLVDRSNFMYQLLIGRNFLETGDFLVDAGSELTSHRSKCK